MLDFNPQKSSLRDVIASLPCSVQLPTGIEASLQRRGSAPACPDERRRTQRVAVEGGGLLAALEYHQTFAAVPRRPGWHRLRVADLSARGIGFFHGEQLFPGERMRIVLLTGDCRTIEMARCLRLGPRCYRIGARFVRTEEGGEAAAAPRGERL